MPKNFLGIQILLFFMQNPSKCVTNSENITKFVIERKITKLIMHKKFVLGLSARAAEAAHLEESEGMLRPRRRRAAVQILF